MTDHEDAFQELAEQVDRDAAAIKCSQREYREGLRTIIEQLRAAITASEETDRDVD